MSAVLAVIAIVPTFVLASGAPATAAINAWNAKNVPIAANDVAYDALRDVLLTTVASVDSSLGNELVEVDPETGTIGRHVFVGSDPGPIALTDDGTTAYVGLWGANRIVRVNLASFTVTQSFVTASDWFYGPLYVEDIAAAPGRNDLVAASLWRPDISPRHGGVWVFDDGVVLANHTSDHTGANRIEFAGPTTVYGYNNETTEFGFRRIDVTATGAATASAGPSAISGFGVDIEYAEGLVYGTNGIAIEPSTREAVQSYSNTYHDALEVTPADDRITFVRGQNVSVYDAPTGGPIESRSFSGLPPEAWTLEASATGFALIGNSGLWLLGPSVTGGTVVLPPPATSALGDIVAVEVPLHANAVLYDAVHDRAYVSVPSDGSTRAGQVVAIDPVTGAVLDSVFVGSNPGPLALTGDGAFLHVGLNTIGRVTKLDAATLDVVSSFSLGNSQFNGPLVAEDIEVRPGTTDTLAISLRNTCCSPRHEGDAIFSNGTRLANSTPSHTGANRIEFTDANTLVGINNETTGFEFYRMAVGPTGVTRTSTTGRLFDGFGVHLDITAGRGYLSTGQVVDPAVPEVTGSYAYGGAMEAVPALGRTFIAWEGGLEEYDLDEFRPVTAWEIDLGTQPHTLDATHDGLMAATSSAVFLLTPSAEFPWAQPAVTALSPTSGPTAGGTTVSIFGSGFSGTTAVKFGTSAAVSFSVVDDQQIRAIAPAQAAGPVSVTVTTPGGTSAAGGGSTYTYVAPAPPAPPSDPSPPPTLPLTPPPPSPPTTVPPVPVPPVAPLSGYWMVGAKGDVYAFGGAAWLGNTPALASRAVDIEPTPSRNGYWIVEAHGQVYTMGDAPYLGGSPALGATETVTSLSATTTGAGYWLFTSKGRVIAYGDAAWYGDMAGVALNGPVLDSIPTASGRGYYMVGSDGGIFTFGDAAFEGSMGGAKLNAPVQSLVPDPDGKGYWLVASDGGIFAFDAPFYGSMGGTKLNRPVTGMVGASNGYLMVSEDGGIFTFGDAPFLGSLGASPPAQPITSVATR